MRPVLQIKGFLIDMDGLLLDTERVSHRSWMLAEEKTGFRLPPEMYATLIGQSMVAIGNRLREVVSPDCDVEAFLKVASRFYRTILEEEAIPLKQGAREFLGFLSDAGIPRCLATSTERNLCGHKLEASGLADLIPLRVCGDDVSHSKPAPDIYLKAAGVLGEDSSDLLVLEDSENGIRAALSAGCKVAHIPDMGPVSLEWQVRTDRVFKSLDDLRAALERREIEIA